MSWPALLARVRPHRRTLALSGVLALLGAAGGLAQPLAAREVIEALADDESLLVPLVVLGGLVAFRPRRGAAGRGRGPVGREQGGGPLATCPG